MPYTQALLSAVPVPDPNARTRKKRIVLTGDVPSPANPPSGCRLHPLLPRKICAPGRALMVDRGQGHPSACHFAEAVDVVALEAGREG